MGRFSDPSKRIRNYQSTESGDQQGKFIKKNCSVNRERGSEKEGRKRKKEGKG